MAEEIRAPWTEEQAVERLASLRRAMTAPMPSDEQIAEGIAADKAMADRVHKVRPGVPLHHAFAVLQALRSIQWIDKASQEDTRG